MVVGSDGTLNPPRRERLSVSGRGGLLWLCFRMRRTENGKQLAKRLSSHRFGDVQIEAAVVGAPLILISRPGGHCNDDEVHVRSALTNFPDSLVAIEAGHPDVEKNHVRLKR